MEACSIQKKEKGNCKKKKKGRKNSHCECCSVATLFLITTTLFIINCDFMFHSCEMCGYISQMQFHISKCDCLLQNCFSLSTLNETGLHSFAIFCTADFYSFNMVLACEKVASVEERFGRWAKKAL